jgi:ABC-type transport system substrate-binding protein
MKKLIAMILALAMVLALASCGGSSNQDSTSSESPSTDATSEAPAESDASGEAEESQTSKVDIVHDGSYVATGTAPENLYVGTSEELGLLLPYNTGNECGAGLFLVYDMIFYFDANGNVATDILTDYHYEDDGLTLVMTLRDDIVFTSGNKATGEDLLFSISSNVDPERGAVTTNYDYFDFDNSYVGDDGYTVYLKCVDGVSAVSQFNMLNLTCLLDKAWVEENGWDSELWYTGPSGSGPYVVSDYLTGNKYVFTRRDDYWMTDTSDRNLPGTVTVTAYAEKSTMYMDLEGGAISIAIECSSEDYQRAVEDDSDNIDGGLLQGNVCNWVVFGIEDGGPTADINVRKAIAHGVNWDDIATAGKGIIWDPATSTLPSYFPDYVNEGQYEYDPDYARECLAEAGYSVDNPLDLYMVLSVNAIDTGAVLQAYLADIGINLTFDGYDIATAVPLWLDGEGDISTFAMQGGSMAHDAYWVFKELCSTATMADNRTISDTTIDDCLAGALAATTEEEAHEYYVQIQDWIYDNYRVVSYFEEVNCVCYDTSVVSELHIGPRQYPDLRFISYAE